jgi:hypothetical protein
MLRFVLILYAFATVMLIAGISEHFAPAFFGAFFFGGVATAISYFKWAPAKQERSKIFTGTGNADLSAPVPPRYPPPPAPAMSQPSDGGMSIGIKQVPDAVWVWVGVNEVTKQALTGVLKTKIDEFPLDEERAQQSLREFSATLEELISVPPFSPAEARLKRQEHLAQAKKDFFTAKPIQVRDLISGPFRYPVSNAQDAADFIERLKTKTLPKLKKMIEAQSDAKTQTFEL